MSRRPVPVPALGVLMTLLSVTTASAVDVPLTGGRMKLVDASGPSGRRNLVGFLDPAVDLEAVDPTVTGATAFIGRPGIGTVTELPLPASGWKATGKAPRIDFKFKSRAGAVRSARLVNGRSLRFIARGPGAYPLDGTPQGEIGVLFVVGDARLCGLFGGEITRDDGTRFRARHATAPATCPALGSLVTTTTSPNSTTTTTIGGSTTTTTTLPDGCDLPSGANSRPAGCPCVGNNDCCAVCGGSVENPICGGNIKPGAPAACYGPECDYPPGANSRAAGCPCVGNNDCCAVCGGSVENPICGGIIKPDPPAACLD
jgi:hypothetical protein